MALAAGAPQAELLAEICVTNVFHSAPCPKALSCHSGRARELWFMLLQMLERDRQMHLI